MEINSLKINQEISDIKEQLSGLLDLFYPVGSYYETSDISFFPEAVWGGTWRMDTKGYVTLGVITIFLGMILDKMLHRLQILIV